LNVIQVRLGDLILAAADVHDQPERQGNIRAVGKEGDLLRNSSSETSTSFLVRLSTSAPRESWAEKATFTSLTLTGSAPAL